MLQGCSEPDLCLLYTSPAKCLKLQGFSNFSPGPRRVPAAMLCCLNGDEPMREPSLIRFSVFEMDLRTRELRKSGLRLKVQEQPFQVLEALLERPGELVTREELQSRIWGNTTVDFDQSLNRAVNKLRDALGDGASTPRFIETLPRRGYRFIGSLEPVRTTE